MGITELAEVVRAGLDADERIALAVGADSFETADYLWDTKYVILHCGGEKRVTTEMDADLAEHAARHDPARVLAEVAAKRQLLDQALGWEHVEHEDEWHSCNAHPARTSRWPGQPVDLCTCGRDERVLAVLQALAAPYQETS